MSATIIIIAITCLISFAAFRNTNLKRSFAHHPYSEDKSKQYYRLLTSGFLHGDTFHLFVNMYVLYGFGTFVEQMFQLMFGSTTGLVIFVSFYLLMIVLSSIPTHFKHRSNPGYSAIGASGATSAVLFSFVVFRPLAELELYFFFPIPAIIFAVLYLWYSSWAGKKALDNIGHDAHFFGAVAGFLFTILLKPDLFLSFLDQILSVFK